MSLQDKLACQEDSFGPFCETLLLDILSRLLIKDLIRCKCVSKEWYKLISHVCVPQLSAQSPVSGVYFRVAPLSKDLKLNGICTSSPQEVKNKLHDQVACCDHFHYVDSAPLQPLLEPFGENVASMSCASILPFDHGDPDFLDCCNGLVLFVQRPKPQFYVCNPAMRQCVPIPLPPPSIHLPSLFASLAFDPSESIYYKLVISSILTEPQCLHIFYSETGEWLTHKVRAELPSFSKGFQLVRHSVYLKGVVYRLSLLNKILCVDLNSLKVRVINCPYENHPPICEEGLKYPPPPGCIGVFKKALSYISKEDDYVYVWLLDNSYEPYKWNLKHKICFSDIVKCVSKISIHLFLIWLHPCAFHPTSDILFLASARSIVMYHIESGRAEKVRQIFYRAAIGGYYYPLFTYRCTYVALKNWCRSLSAAENNNYQEVCDKWCFIEQ